MEVNSELDELDTLVKHFLELVNRKNKIIEDLNKRNGTNLTIGHYDRCEIAAAEGDASTNERLKVFKIKLLKVIEKLNLYQSKNDAIIKQISDEYDDIQSLKNKFKAEKIETESTELISSHSDETYGFDNLIAEKTFNLVELLRLEKIEYKNQEILVVIENINELYQKRASPSVSGKAVTNEMFCKCNEKSDTRETNDNSNNLELMKKISELEEQNTSLFINLDKTNQLLFELNKHHQSSQTSTMSELNTLLEQNKNFKSEINSLKSRYISETTNLKGQLIQIRSKINEIHEQEIMVIELKEQLLNENKELKANITGLKESIEKYKQEIMELTNQNSIIHKLQKKNSHSLQKLQNSSIIINLNNKDKENYKLLINNIQTNDKP